MKLILFFLVFSALAAAQEYPLTKDVSVYEDDYTILSFDMKGDVSGDSLCFGVKPDRTDTSSRVMQKFNTAGGGDDTQIKVTYSSNGKKSLVQVFIYSTDVLNPAIYYYDLTKDSTTIYTGIYKVRDDVTGLADGVATRTPYYTVALDTTTLNPGIPIFYNSDNSQSYVSYEGLLDSIGAVDSLSAHLEKLDSLFTKTSPCTDTSTLKTRAGKDGWATYLTAINTMAGTGGGWFVYIDSTYQEGGMAFDAPVSGKQWARAELSSVNYVKPEWYGAVVDDDIDDQPYIQKAIDQIANSNSRINTIRFSGGEYTLDSSLIIYSYTTDYQFVTVQLIGDEITNSGAKMPTLKATFSDNFAIGIHKGRACVIKGLSIQGQNNPTISWHQVIADTGWVESGVRDSRYSPYAGIIIDPFRYNAPPDGGYPDLSSYYKGAVSIGGSSRIRIEGCKIQYFTVGIAVGINGYTQNAEEIYIKDNWIDYNKISVAIGQSQSRTNYIEGLTCWGGARYIVDCSNYGTGNGVAPYIDGMNIAGSNRWLITCTPGWASTINIKNVYSEGLASIGFLGESGQGKPGSIKDSYFKFYVPQTQDDFDMPSECNVSTNVKFINTYFGTYSTPYKTISFTGTGYYDFDNCQFEVMPIISGVFSNTNNWKMRNTTIGFTHPPVSNDQSYPINSISTFNKKYVQGGQTIIPYVSNKAYIKVTDYYEKTLLGSYAVTVDSVTHTASFTISDTGMVRVGSYIGTSAANIYIDAPDSGTVSGVYSQKIGYVSAIDGTTITLHQVNKNITSGSTYNLYRYSCPLFHEPSFGDVTSGNDTIKNVTNASTIWGVGNPIHGTGIPDGATINAISDTNIVISRNATATNTGVYLYGAAYTITEYATTTSEASGVNNHFIGNIRYNTSATEKQDTISEFHPVLNMTTNDTIPFNYYYDATTILSFLYDVDDSVTVQLTHGAGGTENNLFSTEQVLTGRDTITTFNDATIDANSEVQMYYTNIGDTAVKMWISLKRLAGKYIITGWRRMTNGSANVLGTDWVEMRTYTGN